MKKITYTLTTIIALSTNTTYANSIYENLATGIDLARSIEQNSGNKQHINSGTQTEGEGLAKQILNGEVNTTQGGVTREAEGFAQNQLDRYEANNPYNSEAEKIVNSYEQIKETSTFKDGQDLAKSVNLKEPFEVEHVEGKLADAKGVNLDVALSRYWKKFNDGKKRQENLPDVMVFVSFSMPENSLRELSEQVKQVGGQLVFRGMVKNSMQVTAQAMLGLNSSGVKAIIHPKLYERFEVKQVPTFILVNSKEAYCASDNCTPLHDRMSGNVSLGYALEEFASSGDHNELAASLLEKVRGQQ